MPRRRRQLAALAIAVLALAGCQGGANPNGTPSTAPPNTVTPSTATPTTGASPSCNHPAVLGGGDGDGGLQVDWDYEESHHDFGTGAPITLCMDLEADEVVVRVTGNSPEVTVTPETLPGPGTRFTFTVTVQPGATGNLDVRFGDEAEEAGEAGISFHGPAIMTDETGWSFGPWG